MIVIGVTVKHTNTFLRNLYVLTVKNEASFFSRNCLLLICKSESSLNQMFVRIPSVAYQLINPSLSEKDAVLTERHD